ncbi:zinc-binding dehydrogenase [Capillimicrobium parvum]|uniref:L-threonine 3-dehydrogenase n=1 Tax=Capillimicrobium parvum TaxID=2884022 RepID=A0A9E6XTI7_9ACTN|nr:zinc-binding alcohol dehydrogenase [Capillimicrobium parvum]UGS34284.1 L-threonine 3-dehydrogenase [Capillimicrobium parvum]
MDATALWIPRQGHAELRPDTAADPAPHEIRVRAIASGISTGTELVLYHGLGPAGQAMTPSTCEGRWDLPVKYGYQSVGRVIDAGRDSGYREGELVFCRYPHQDVYTIDATDPELVYRIPEFDPPEIGVLGNNADVALTALLDVPVRLGDVVVVVGLGIVGMFCALLARRTAGTLVVVDPFEYRRDIALRLGADVAVHPDDAAAAVAEASEGRGSDVSIEASGAASGLQLAIDVSGLEADVCVVGWYGAKQIPLVLAPQFYSQRLKLVSSSVLYAGSGLQPRWDLGRKLQAALDLLPSMHPEEMISHRIPFAQAPDAFTLLDEHLDQTLAVILTYE